MKDLIHVYLDGDHWCAIYPMGSNLMDCEAVAFSPINKQFNDVIGRERDYGKDAAIAKLRKENPTIACSYYCDYWD